MSVKVKNYNGSSRWARPSCKCGSWIEHWEVNSGLKLQDFCRACKETVGAENLEGGHVVKVSSDDDKVYIVPICQSCNNKEDDFEFSVDESALVRANGDYCKNN